MSTLRRFVDVRPEEQRNTLAAFGALLAITTGHTLLETARDALFLSKLPAAQLPWMYLIIVVLALALAQIRRADSKTAILGVLVAAAGLTAGFWTLASDVASRPWVLYALYVWSGLFASWVTVQFWTLLGRAHTMTQAKRLYGFIGAGAVLGGVLGAFAARAALAFVPPRAMLLVSAALFLLAALPVLAVSIPDAAATPTSAPGQTKSSMTTGTSLLWSNAFARRILGIVLVATVAVTLTDFLFKMRLAEQFTDTHELAARLSTFYAIVNTLALVAQLFIGPWIFRSAGVQRALFFFPVLLLGAAGGVLVTGGRLLSAVLLKAIDGTLRYSVHKTSMELLLVPIPDGTRERVKPIIDLLGVRGGQALASVAILGLVAIGAAKPMTVGAFIVTLTVLWVSIVVTIRAHYLNVFRETLRAGGLSGNVELPELDLSTLEMLFTGLNSSRDVEVLASLELLAEQHRERLIPALILYHPSRDVVLRALDIFTQRGRADFVSIADRLNGHPDRDVAAAALRARTAVAPDRKLLEERLADRCSQVSATALVALMARGWIESEEADRRVRQVLATRSWQTAAELARAIRDIGSAADAGQDTSLRAKAVSERFDDLLIQLAREAGSFGDVACEATIDAVEGGVTREAAPPVNLWGGVALAPDMRVRLEVARAMAVRKSPKFLPVLVGMLNRHELRATARGAIAPIPGALDFLDEVMGQRDFARTIRMHLPRTMVLLDPDAAARKLMVHLLSEKDGAVRFKVLRGLVKLRRKNKKLLLETDLLRRFIDTTLDHTEELRRWRVGLAGVDDDAPPASLVGADPMRAAHHLLVDLVRDKESHATQRVFMMLELIYGEDFETIERGLRSKKPKTRASSLELVENIVRPPLRGRILALVGDGAPAVANAVSYEQAVLDILAKGGATMRTLAEYRALELGLDTVSITGKRPSQAPTIESIGKRLVDRARDLLTPDTQPSLTPTGASRASA
jgi:AAA family ATP:ADP antiporter